MARPVEKKQGVKDGRCGQTEEKDVKGMAKVGKVTLEMLLVTVY